MSIADHFEQAPDAGFIRDYSTSTARRQFHQSIVLIVLLALASAALGFVVRFDGPSSQTDSYAQTVAPPAYVGGLSR